jgi:hypothetical protein
MSVQFTNLVSKLVLSFAIESGSLAWAAQALNSPIGPLGGAFFGAVRHISQLPLKILTQKGLNTEHPQASAAAKTLANATVFFGSYAAAWGALASVGVSLTVSHVVSLSLLSAISASTIEILFDCLGISAIARQA